MIDTHAHLERGPYTAEWVDLFVDQAVRCGIEELRLVEHTTCFHEFKPFYEHLTNHPEAGEYQVKWLEKKFTRSIRQYEQLVTAMRARQFPITVRFGLEVCYFPQHEAAMGEKIREFDWDYWIGSIHWIDGFGFDHKESIPVWQRADVNGLYRRYYELMEQAVRSGMFQTIAHPDSIKCWNFYPTTDMRPAYASLAALAREKGVVLEFNGGLVLNYGHHELGMNPALLAAVREAGTSVVTASDAHRPEDVGMNIDVMTAMLNQQYSP